MNKLLAVAFLLIPSYFCIAQAPRISYAEPEREDSRRTDFEIIGKMNGNFLVYKNNKNDHTISLYDEQMNLKDREKLDFIPERWINVDFITYPDFSYLIYQYERKNVVYCSVVKIDAAGRKISEPMELDTTEIGFASNNKIYTTINSDDKQRIMIFKINSKNSKNFYFTTLLYDNNLNLIRRDRMNMPMDERNEFFTDFMLANDGEMLFGKFLRPSSNSEYISKVSMVAKFPDSSEFSVRPVDIGFRLLDELKLKVDNTNKRILVNALYYRERRGNVEGVYSLFWDKSSNTKIIDTVFAFDDELRGLAKSADGNRRYAFNDYYIKSITTRKDGGFVIISESLYSSSRGNTFNRWDYSRWGSPWMSPMDYYYWSPIYSPGFMPWGGNRFNNFATRYFADNIMILSFNREGGLEWSNVVQKSQFDDENDNTLSFQTLNTGGELHFLFNQFEKRALMLTDQTIGADGKITRVPTLKNLDKGYEFMPRFAKQVSARQVIVPCLYRGYLCFAKIDF
ncbi:MAG: hypothetical protein H7Y03_06960 [Chitinophagaceae bacterium]|nr:hypothetical protein [Chitinophagaceae bacterium]